MSFSLKHLLFVILVAAVGLAALTNADLPFVAEFVNLCTLAIIILMGYGAWISAGSQRAFRIGFVAWSIFYVVLSVKLLGYQFAHVTYTLLNLGWRALLPSRISSLTGDAFMEAEADWISRFMHVGQCLFALLFGLLGGWVTVYFYRKRQRMLAQRS